MTTEEARSEEAKVCEPQRRNDTVPARANTNSGLEGLRGPSIGRVFSSLCQVRPVHAFHRFLTRDGPSPINYRTIRSTRHILEIPNPFSPEFNEELWVDRDMAMAVGYNNIAVVYGASTPGPYQPHRDVDGDVPGLMD